MGSDSIMARLPRFVIPGQPQHIIQRGNNREVIFAADEDYRFYLERLKEACDRHQCDVHAYVLMTNHVHLLMTPHKEEGIGKVLQSLGRYYVQYFNYTYGRTGTLWEGRYKATLIDSDNYLLSCCRYIELNPVRAGMVEHPAEYVWSSYGFNGLGKDDPLIIPHPLYRALGQTAEARQMAYRQLFRTRLSEKTLQEIRAATNKAWVLGNERFKDQIFKLTGRQVMPKARGGDRRPKVGQKCTFNRV